MLRPSRPMMRPFMSSAWSWTTETVVSAAWPAARRCMTTERMLRTRRSASRLVSSSIARSRCADSWRTWSSSSFIRSALASEAGRPELRSSWRTVFSRISAIWPSFSASRRSRSASSAPRASSASSRPCSRVSRRVVSARRAESPSSGTARTGGAFDALVAAPDEGARLATRAAATTRPRATTTPAITISIAFPLPGAASRRAAARAQLLPVHESGRPSLASASAEERAGRRPRGRPVRWRLSCGVGSVLPGAPARMRCLIVRSDGSRWPSSLKLLLPRRKCGFAGFSRAVVARPVAGPDRSTGGSRTQSGRHSKAGAPAWRRIASCASSSS